MPAAAAAPSLPFENIYLRGLPLALLTIALSLANFMQVLDFAIANVSLPTIAGNLGASTSQGTWVITSYSVANAVFIPVTGWLAKRVGEVRLFLVSTLLFGFASLLCGLAPNIESLVLFRAIQGAVAGPMMPLSQSLLLNNYPPHKRNMALAIWSMITSVAPIFGPIIGGFISDNYFWGWIFIINVPLTIVVLLLVWQVLRGRETNIARGGRMNYVGLALLVVGIAAFQMMLDRGKELDWFNSNEIITLAVVAFVCIVFLIAWELTDKDPIIDLRLFKSRNFTVATICISLGMMINFGVSILLPLLLQTQFGYTATLSGFVTAPVGVIPILLVPFVGRHAHKVDLRILCTFSYSVFAISMYMRTFFAPNIDMDFVILPMFVQGLGSALFFVPLIAIAFTGLKPEQMTNASSLFNCIRIIFGAIGTSVASTLWERREAVHHTRLTAAIDPYNPLATDAFNNLHALGLDLPSSGKLLAAQITKQGFILGAAEIYAAATVGFIILAAVIWFARPERA